MAPGAPMHPPSVWVSTAGNDSNCARLDRSKPCKTLDRANRVARPGDQVEIAAGSYPAQDVLADPTKTSEADVVFRPAPGADVVVDDIDVWADHIEFRRLRINVDFYAKCGADDVTLRSSKARLFFIRSAKRVSLIDSEFGPSDDISQIGHTEECQSAPEQILLDRCTCTTSGPDADEAHGVLDVQAANNIVVRNSRFQRCEDFDIFIKPGRPCSATRTSLFENNWFDRPDPTPVAAISLSQPESGGRPRERDDPQQLAGTPR